MYIIQCTKSGVCDFYNDKSLDYGASFRKGQYMTDDHYATRSLDKAVTFRTKKAFQEFMSDMNCDLNEDNEPIPEFKPVPVILSLK